MVIIDILSEIFMQISWSGFGSFRLQENSTTIQFDPVEEGSNFKLRKSTVSALTLSHPRTKEDLATVGPEAFVIDCPGEYEVQGIFIQGIAYNVHHTAYLITMGDISVAWLGPINNEEVSDQVLEAIEGADILLIPVGGGKVLSAKQAVSVINKVEPRIVIPAYYKLPIAKGFDDLAGFIKEYGAAQETTDKFKVSKKDLQMEDTKVIVIKP